MGELRRRSHLVAPKLPLVPASSSSAGRDSSDGFSTMAREDVDSIALVPYASRFGDFL
jgi:hypothetical protein